MQNLVTLNFTSDELNAIDQTLTTLEQQLAGLITLSNSAKQRMSKLGDKSDTFCRRALEALSDNPQILPPNFDLSEAQRDLVALDQLRPLAVRIRQLANKIDDSEMALGSDILSSALEGYALAKAVGKGAALDAMRESMAQRYGHRRKASKAPVS